MLTYELSWWLTVPAELEDTDSTSESPWVETSDSEEPNFAFTAFGIDGMPWAEWPRVCKPEEVLLRDAGCIGAACTMVGPTAPRLASLRTTALLLLFLIVISAFGQRWQWPQFSPLPQPDGFQNHMQGLHVPVPCNKEPWLGSPQGGGKPGGGFTPPMSGPTAKAVCLASMLSTWGSAASLEALPESRCDDSRLAGPKEHRRPGGALNIAGAAAGLASTVSTSNSTSPETLRGSHDSDMRLAGPKGGNKPGGRMTPVTCGTGGGT